MADTFAEAAPVEHETSTPEKTLEGGLDEMACRSSGGRIYSTAIDFQGASEAINSTCEVASGHAPAEGSSRATGALEVLALPVGVVLYGLYAGVGLAIELLYPVVEELCNDGP